MQQSIIEITREAKMRPSTRFSRVVALFIVGLLSAILLVSPSDSLLGFGERALGQEKDTLGDPLPEGSIARCGTTRMRSLAGIRSISYGADGKILVVAGGGEVRIYNAEIGAAAEPPMVKSTYDQAVCSPDGKWLATGTFEGGLSLLDLDAGKSYPVQAGVG
jgi:hypothetical protein